MGSAHRKTHIIRKKKRILLTGVCLCDEMMYIFFFYPQCEEACSSQMLQGTGHRFQSAPRVTKRTPMGSGHHGIVMEGTQPPGRETRVEVRSCLVTVGQERTEGRHRHRRTLAGPHVPGGPRAPHAHAQCLGKK